MPEFDTDEMYDALNLTEWERNDYYYEALFDWLESGLDPAEYYGE